MAGFSAGTIYRGGQGMWTWVLHRITGVAVFFFLLVHVLDTALVRVSPGDTLQEKGARMLKSLVGGDLMLPSAGLPLEYWALQLVPTGRIPTVDRRGRPRCCAGSRWRPR